MAAPAFQSVQVATTAGATSLAITKPTSLAAGDLLIAHITVRVTTAVTAPAGWTLIQSSVRSAHQTGAWYRLADGTEGASFSWSWATSVKAVGAVCRVTGSHQTTPINVTGSVATTGVASSVAAPSITTTADECLLFGFAYSADNKTFTSPGSMTERWDQQTTNFNDVYHAGATETLGAAGATGTRTFASGDGSTLDGGAFLFAVAPPAPVTFTQALGLMIFGA
jgi:hypothetical protein